MARLLWWYLLWLMRRPWMKRLQRYWLTHIIRASRREKALEVVKRQNLIARRYGLPVLRLTMNAVLASVLITLTYLIASNLYDAGAFSVPPRKS